MTADRTHADAIREAVIHIARGCLSGTSHEPYVYQGQIREALDALLADLAEANERGERAGRERDGALADCAFAEKNAETGLYRAEQAEQAGLLTAKHLDEAEAQLAAAREALTAIAELRASRPPEGGWLGGRPFSHARHLAALAASAPDTGDTA